TIHSFIFLLLFEFYFFLIIYGFLWLKTLFFAPSAPSLRPLRQKKCHEGASPPAPANNLSAPLRLCARNNCHGEDQRHATNDKRSASPNLTLCFLCVLCG
ncbi:MAG: hypothetical protein J6333_04665, partial [Planctomycetes bacterium]|nr:hypothetical protein [Planctomycetota bacterium]